ncbi:hypothetical protein PAXRUDRAFT_441481 [Paxillus rubicundulus Ve08.2h10]|uniref:Uncharacterized protein n=1 Tax=Paxillus rubicundulus Ve08.2h10 TaxID=930991 RepID=A0A0D0E831_9AGAM|nr:hypothetical protein PAXRUDRAFT_441481 [Paxillus rubicundulus Ve08.2h10]
MQLFYPIINALDKVREMTSRSSKVDPGDQLGGGRSKGDLEIVCDKVAGCPQHFGRTGHDGWDERDQRTGRTV